MIGGEPMSTHGTFATAINCMDGRVQLPVTEWLKNTYRVDYVDMITEPGPNKILAENVDTILIESIKKRVAISTGKHGSQLIAVIGHHDCAGNPTDRKTQTRHITDAARIVQSWNKSASVIGLWVDEDWEVNPIEQP